MHTLSLFFRINNSNNFRYYAKKTSNTISSGHHIYKNISKFSTKKSSGFVCLILGKPGGGKGTISKKIIKDYPIFKHLSSGDVLRHHVNDKTSVGLQAKQYMDQGKLVPDEVMINLLLEDTEALLHPKQQEGASASSIKTCSLLLDGFPRNVEQAIALEKRLHVDFVINLNIPTETIVHRLSDRWIHVKSGRVYNYEYNPPKVNGKDDETGEDLIQREDDKPENIRKRLEAYDEVTLPMVEYYEQNGVCKTFSGTMSDVIYVSVNKWLQELIE